MLSKIVSRAAVGAMLVSAAFVVSACAPPQSTPEPPADAASGGVLRYQLYQAPTSFNPYAGTNGADGEINSLQFRPLVRLKGTEFVPAVAGSWEPNDDASVWTFELGDLVWSDGEPLTFDDVIYSYETALDPDTAASNAGLLTEVEGATEFSEGTADSVSGFNVVDDDTLEISLVAPNAAFLAVLPNLPIVPEHVYGELDRAQLAGNPAFHEPTVGSGPYVFSEWVTDDQIKFVPNEQSPEAHPLDELYAQFLEGDVARAQLETGEIDIAQIASVDADAVEALGTVNVQVQPGNAVMSLYTALGTGKLADVRVRQAILHAIDRESIVENVIAGKGEVADTLLFAPDWAVPDGLTHYDYDPEKAAELLEEAGWDFNTPIDLTIVPGQADRDAVFDIIAGQLSEIGLKAQVKQVQPAELTKIVTDRTFDIIITPQSLNPAEPGSINPRWMCDGGQNISQYCNEELDELLKAGVSTSDQAEREPIYADANRILNHDVPAMPLYVPTPVWGSTPRVQGFDPAKGAGVAQLPGAEDWSVTAE